MLQPVHFVCFIPTSTCFQYIIFTHTQSDNQNSSNNIGDVQIGSVIELLWPKTDEWVTGEIVYDWQKNGEFAIKFPQDPFDEPLTYKLSNYEWRLLENESMSNINSKSKNTRTRRICKKPNYKNGDNRQTNPTNSNTNKSNIRSSSGSTTNTEDGMIPESKEEEQIQQHNGDGDSNNEENDEDYEVGMYISIQYKSVVQCN